MTSNMEQNGERAPQITIIHFNDVYNVEEQKREPKAGAARFKTAMDSFRDRDPLRFFSGDALSPSIMSTFTKGEQMLTVLNSLGLHCAVYGNHDFVSTFTKGEQMLTVLNSLGLHCAVYGNHDFDFGLDRILEVKEGSNFPWLLSNVIDNETNRPLGEGKETHIIKHHGWTIGLIGLAEQEWLCSMSTINLEQLTYYDYLEKGRELAKQLRNQGCNYIIALTHFRTPNDIRLAENADEIDLFLAGHDHDYEIIKVSNNNKVTVKSGCDFRTFSVLTLTENEANVDVQVDKVVVDSRYDPDPQLAQELVAFQESVDKNMERNLGRFAVDLDGRFAEIRTSETNLGNFMCDVMVACTNSDVAILNSGALRSDRVHLEGDFNMRDLMTILPMMDPMVVIEVTGEKIVAALENGVSQYPKLDGRFLQMSGIQYIFDPSAPPGERVFRDLVKIGGEFVVPEASYRVVTICYVQKGKEGYDMLADCPIVQDEEQCPTLPTAVQNHFEAIKIKEGKTKRKSSHRQNLVLLSRRDSRFHPKAFDFVNESDEDESDLNNPKEVRKSANEQWTTLRLVRQTLSNIKLKEDESSSQEDSEEDSKKLQTEIKKSPAKKKTLSVNERWNKLRIVSQSLSFIRIKKEHVEQLENETCKMAPKVEGRIRIVTDAIVATLRAQKEAPSVEDT